MNLDIIATYFPEASTIPADILQLSRKKVEAWLRPSFPSDDMSPGTVVGDLVSIMALWLAGRSVSLDRFTSDLDPANVARNIIFSCPFVARYLDNFGVYDVDNMPGRGLVRLTFSSNDLVVINRSIRFRFSSTDDYAPRVVGDASGIHVYPAGTPSPVDPNTYVLSQLSASAWAVDIPVTGTVTSEVTRGAGASATLLLPSISSMVAAMDFVAGVPPTSLPELARLTRQAAHAATPSSRGGTRSMVLRNWPETRTVEPVLTGDPELQRASPSSAVILQEAAMDIFYRSRQAMQQETQTVRLSYDPALNEFRGRLDLLHRPTLIEQVLWVGNSQLPIPGVTTYSRIGHVGLPGHVGAGSRHEQVWIRIVPPLDDNGVALIARQSDTLGLHALFQITYRCDPMLGILQRTLESSEYAPVGVSVMVRACPLLLVDRLTVSYTRQPGVTFLRTAAEAEIIDYVNTSDYRNPFSAGGVGEIMMTAGALRVKSVVPAGKIMFTAATRRFNKTFNPAVSDAWEANSQESPDLPIESESDMSPFITESTLVGDEVERYAVTHRNSAAYIDSTGVEFEETLA